MDSSFLAAIMSSETVPRLRECTMDALEYLGFQQAYFLAPVTRDARFGRVIAPIGFPADWVAAYERELRFVDPLPALALDLARAFRWSDVVRLTTLTEAQAAFMDGLAAVTVGDGVAVATFGPGGRAGFVAMGGRTTSDAIAVGDLFMAQCAAQMSYLHYCALIDSTRAFTAPLSQRELDVIYWIALGKSNSIIAELLDISPGTVDAYVRRIFAKLGVNDRTSAVTTAMARGDIYLGEYRRVTEQEDDGPEANG